ncbi:hypothetical protein BIV60_02135 [Bacillus sp. MUM 116]|uniref:tetratricopeptide repeat protein n=1 Tax=Bacillus sp. MUM 116 TaxID=1678002 RepID=UPI0008F5656A|nr:hypothetical protein [Bacillus sp. MUM 116]OIK16837.1 hypothetical protein BIV60_02135 [Bacillus sp. MUM 116]
MDKELLKPTEISIKDKKKLIKGNILRAALFARSKVVEVMTENNDRYYLIYYKNALIYGEQLTQTTEGTFIEKAFQNGIALKAPNPMLSTFIPSLNVTIPNKNKLFSQLQLHYSLQEVAYIATTLDSFFEKNQLIPMIDKIYYHLRRSGKFMKSFQIIQILSEFSPDLKSAKDRSESHEYFSYHDFYKTSSLPAILKKDPLYVELYCFKNRLNPDKHKFLEEILTQQDCTVEVILLWLERVVKLQVMESVEKYTALALQCFIMEEWMLILSEVNMNPFQILPEAKSLIEKMITKGNNEKAALYLFPFLDDLPHSYELILSSIWEYSDPKFVFIHLDNFLVLLQKFPEHNKTTHLEQKMFQLVILLLKEHDLQTVRDILLPVNKAFSQLNVFEKINKMAGLEEDPDRMMELGDYYAEFHQYDKAIDCFFWEMELQPQNPVPVQKISKMYQKKGMVKEAAAYQKISDQLSHTG